MAIQANDMWRSAEEAFKTTIVAVVEATTVGLIGASITIDARWSFPRYTDRLAALRI